MELATAISLVAVLVALVAVLGLVAVYGRLRQLEAGAATDLSGYSAASTRIAPSAVLPRAGATASLVAVLDRDCAMCHVLWLHLSELRESGDYASLRIVGLLDAPVGDAFGAFGGGSGAELLVDASARADLYEGYAPTLLAVDREGEVRSRRFVYADTDIPSTVRELADSVRRPVTAGK